MGFLVALLLLLISAGVVLVVSAPLRGRPDAASGEVRRDDLLAAREAKYREIRDAELDYRTGKLSQSDYETIDATLRAEALEILDALEREGGLSPGTLEQNDSEHEEQDREEDSPAV